MYQIASDPKVPLTKQKAWLAARIGLNSVVEEALRKQVILMSDRNEDGDQLLHVAAATGNERLLELLESRGASSNDPNEAQESPLYLAASGGHAEVVRALLARGAAVNQPNSSGETPLYIASYRGRLPAVRELLRARGVDSARCNEEGASPLDVAAYHQHDAVARLLRRHFRWQRVRLLWLGHLRNASCPLARLPAQLVARIALFTL